MKKGLFLILFFTIYFKSFSQIVYEEGYLINNSNEKIECLIKNNDWKRNPSSFEYKLTTEGAVQTGDIQSVQEFKTINSPKFIRAIVQVDESSLSNLDEDPSPKFVAKQIFLKTILEGKASLYSFEDKSMKRYFYAIDDSEIEQLVYKKYKNGNAISENAQFRNQLINTLVCPSFTFQEFQNIGYTQKELESIFIKYSECTNSTFTTNEKTEKSNSFHLTIRPGISSQNLEIENPENAIEKVDFDNTLGYRIGIEAEFILPFNQNKWGILVEPTFQSYNADKSARTGTATEDNYLVSVKYKSIELPIGFRYYMFLNNNSKLFFNLSYITDLSLASKIEFTRTDGAQIPALEIKSGGNFGIGAGYRYKNKLTVELRHHSNREILGGYHNWTSNYRTTHLILGYTLF